MDPDAFCQEINKLCQDEAELKEGYAPFCKHVFVENFVNAQCPMVELNDDTMPLIVSDYKARTEKVRSCGYALLCIYLN